MSSAYVIVHPQTWFRWHAIRILKTIYILRNRSRQAETDRFMLSRQYCLLSGGGKGRCCLPDSAPQPSQRQQVICDASAEECVNPGLCGDDGYIITDGSGLIDPRITSRTVSENFRIVSRTVSENPESPTER